VREGQKILIEMQPEVALPKERERILTEHHTEVRSVFTTPTSELQGSKNLRRPISRAVQHQIWNRDQGKCTKCGSCYNSNILWEPAREPFYYK